MKQFDDRDAPRRKKKKKKKPADSGSWRLPLLIGGIVAGVVVVVLVVWGIASLFTPGGVYGAAVADARPAGQANPRVNPSPDSFPAVQVPITSDGWKLTPDGVPMSSGLTNAVVLPDGVPVAVAFADPARAKAAVVMATFAVQPKEGVPTAVLEKALTLKHFPNGDAWFAGAPDSKVHATLNWLQIDLKTGAVAAQAPLGKYEFVADKSGRFATIFAIRALSPSGDRLAAVVPNKGKDALLVWDAAGKVLREWDDAKLFNGWWLGFATDDLLLARGALDLAGLDVASGKVALTPAVKVQPPFALSPGRKWLAALTPAGTLAVLNTADGTVAGEKIKPLENGTPAALAFTPAGDAVTVTATRKALWLGHKLVLVEDTLFDLDLQMALWKFLPQPGALVALSSPDGRLWSVASFKELDPNRDPRRFKAHPVADAAKAGKYLLTAYTVPDADVRKRLDRGRKGIRFRRGDPVRVEVVGSGSAELRKQAAEGAAAALAKQGLAVDPEAKAGVRLDLSAPKSVNVVSRIPNAPPGMDVNRQSGRSGYQITCKVLFFNRETGVVTPPFTTHDLHGFADAEGRMDVLYSYVGSQAAPPGGVIAGLWDREGQIQMLGTTTLGIDGVLEP
jgi:hypothetical protein